jgi:hypothetical protein
MLHPIVVVEEVHVWEPDVVRLSLARFLPALRHQTKPPQIREHSVNIQWTFSEHSVNIHHSGNIFREHSVNIQWTFSEHSVNIQWTFSEHSSFREHIQWTFSEHSVNIQWTFSEHSSFREHIQGTFRFFFTAIAQLLKRWNAYTTLPSELKHAGILITSNHVIQTTRVYTVTQAF